MKEGKQAPRAGRRGRIGLAMGEPLEAERPPDSRLLRVLGIAGLVGLGFVLDRYNRELLVLLAALLFAGFILREILSVIARSDLLSPGWLLVGVLLVALGAWFFGPDSLTRIPFRVADYLPKAVVDYMDAARRAPAERPLSSGLDAEVEPSRPAARGGATATIRLSSSRSLSAVGEPVTFTARLREMRQGETVRFYAGTSLLGTAAVAEDGTASLTISTLAPGAHEIRAESSRGLSGEQSDVLSHRVSPGGVR